MLTSRFSFPLSRRPTLEGQEEPENMVVSAKLSIDDVKTQARPAVETWTVMAEERYRRRWFVFFDSIPHLHGSGPNGSEAVRPVSTSSSTKKLEMKNERQRMIKEAEKELEKANWQTLYQVTNNSLGSSLDDVKRRAQGDNLKVLGPLTAEMIKPSSKAKVDTFVKGLSPSEQNDFTILMRSLSIAYEKAQTAYNSEYLIKYVPKEIKAESIFVNDPFASSISPPVRYAPPKPAFQPKPRAPSRAATPHMLKPIAAPKPVGKDLLSWAGGADIPNSSYRLFFQKAGEKYPDVIADKVVMSFACGRSVPDSLVDDKYRNSHVVLPVERETMHHLKHKKTVANPSWHLLYKDGVVYTDKPGPHNPGELSIYKKDFTNDTTIVKPAKPTLDPFASSITISMSNFPYLDTTYQSTIGRSSTMAYDRTLV